MNEAPNPGFDDPPEEEDVELDVEGFFAAGFERADCCARIRFAYGELYVFFPSFFPAISIPT